MNQAVDTTFDETLIMLSGLNVGSAGRRWGRQMQMAVVPNLADPVSLANTTDGVIRVHPVNYYFRTSGFLHRLLGRGWTDWVRAERIMDLHLHPRFVVTVDDNKLEVPPALAVTAKDSAVLQTWYVPTLWRLQQVQELFVLLRSGTRLDQLREIEHGTA